MITSQIIDVYRKYEGDDQGLFRAGSAEEQAIAGTGVWLLLANFEQRLKIVNRGLASTEFAAQLIREIDENCDSQETIDKFCDWVARRSAVPSPRIITGALVYIFSKYRGDRDELISLGSQEEKDAAPSEAWGLLAGLVKRQAAVNAWEASPEFAIRLNHDIEANCDSRQTADRLRQLADSSHLN